MGEELRPFSKEQQLARGDRRYRRKVASPAEWQRIIAEKAGPCRVCAADRSFDKAQLVGRAPFDKLEIVNAHITFHHLVAKPLGGDDIARNIVPLCGSGTTGCHGLVEARDKAACKALRLSLTDEEYAYCHTKLGEEGVERRYPIDYEPVNRG